MENLGQQHGFLPKSRKNDENLGKKQSHGRQPVFFTRVSGSLGKKLNFEKKRESLGLKHE